VWALSRGPVAGLPASVPVPGGQRLSPILTSETSNARARLGGSIALGLCRLHHAPNAIFNLRTWLTASVRAAVLPPSRQVLTASAGQ
jgi:hypothetical protein